MMELEPRKLLFGLSLGAAKKIKDPVEAGILKRCPEIQTVCRYRKEGIYQYLIEQENVLVIMEENLQGGSPFSEEELLRLTDLGNSRIIYLLDRSHAGDDYVKALYCCGICDAVYLDEVSPDGVLDLFLHPRGNEAARKYYGIQALRDAEKAGGIVNEGKMGAYLEFIEDACGEDGLGEKYRFVSTRLGAEENRILAAGITGETAHALKGNEVFEFYRNSRERKGFLKKRKREAESTVLAQPETLTEKRDMQTRIAEPAGMPENEEDEMFGAMERFWAAERRDEEEPGQGDRAELLVMMGGYLRTIDG